MHVDQVLTHDDANLLSRINELWFAAKFITAHLDFSLFTGSFSLVQAKFDTTTSISASHVKFRSTQCIFGPSNATN